MACQRRRKVHRSSGFSDPTFLIGQRNDAGCSRHRPLRILEGFATAGHVRQLIGKGRGISGHDRGYLFVVSRETFSPSSPQA